MSTFTLVLNSSNVVLNSNNASFRYSFLNGNFRIPPKSKMCVSSLIVPYSWFNISSIYGNNTFTFTFPQTGSAPAYTITIPDGFYSVSDLNNYFQQFCIANNLYLINSAGQYVYYIVFTANATYYANQLLFFPVPTSLPSGYTAPSGWHGFPATTLCPTITIPAGLGVFLGFSAATYGGTAAANSALSNTTPVGSTVNSIMVRSNVVNNDVSIPSDVIDSVPINSSFGTNINYNPPFEKWVSIKDGVYNQLTLTMSDQSFNTIYARDPNVSITLIIRIGE